MGKARQAHGAAAFGTKIFVFGGLHHVPLERADDLDSPRRFACLLASIECLPIENMVACSDTTTPDFEACGWKAQGRMPFPLADFGTLKTSTGDIIILGGVKPATKGLAIDQPWQLHQWPEKAWCDDTYPRRDYGPACDGCSTVTTNLVYSFNPVTTIWSKLPPLRQPRAQFGCCVLLDGTVVVAGGFSQDDLNNPHELLRSVEVLYPAAEAWAPLAPLPLPLKGLTLSAVHGELFAVGGFDHEQAYDAVLSLQPLHGTWELKGQLGSNRWSHSTIVHNDRLLSLGGLEYQPRHIPRSDIWRTPDEVISCQITQSPLVPEVTTLPCVGAELQQTSVYVCLG